METYKETYTRKNSNSIITLSKQTTPAYTINEYASAYCRAFQNGHWGIAYGQDLTKSGLSSLESQAIQNIQPPPTPPSQHNPPTKLCLPPGQTKSIIFPETPALKEAKLHKLGQFFHDFITSKCPKLEDWQLTIKAQWEEKHLTTTTGASLTSVMPEITLCIKLTAGGYTLEESYGMPLPCDLINKTGVCKAISSLYKHLRRKTNTIPVKKGRTTCIIAPQMASKILGLTIGQHAKADVMQNCFPYAVFLRIPSLSQKVSVIDYANGAFRQMCPFPVFMDDEGVVANNVSLIGQGQMDLCMTNRETAGTMDMPLTGNARTASHKSGPSIHPRNLALMPWDDSVPDMIASIQDGYYLVDGNNGQWGRNGSFALDTTIGYRIKNGRVCESIADAKVSGSMLEFLKSISMVSNDFNWHFNGDINDEIKIAYGAPTIKACLHLN